MAVPSSFVKNLHTANTTALDRRLLWFVRTLAAHGVILADSDELADLFWISRHTKELLCSLAARLRGESAHNPFSSDLEFGAIPCYDTDLELVVLVDNAKEENVDVYITPLQTILTPAVLQMKWMSVDSTFDMRPQLPVTLRGPKLLVLRFTLFPDRHPDDHSTESIPAEEYYGDLRALNDNAATVSDSLGAIACLNGDVSGLICQFVGVPHVGTMQCLCAVDHLKELAKDYHIAPVHGLRCCPPPAPSPALPAAVVSPAPLIPPSSPDLQECKCVLARMLATFGFWSLEKKIRVKCHVCDAQVIKGREDLEKRHAMRLWQLEEFERLYLAQFSPNFYRPLVAQCVQNIGVANMVLGSGATLPLLGSPSLESPLSHSPELQPMVTFSKLETMRSGMYADLKRVVQLQQQQEQVNSRKRPYDEGAPTSASQLPRTKHHCP